jgi:ubiquitin carboxyl-terminal hydrolase 34
LCLQNIAPVHLVAANALVADVGLLLNALAFLEIDRLGTNLLIQVERPAKDVSACYFSAEPSLVDRLMKILHVALAASTDQIVVVWPAYAAILEASLHSRGIWDAFVAREDGIELHKALLLTDSRRVLREHTGRAIASVSGGHLPSTSPLTSTETATHFWAIISKVLPAAVQYPTQAEQLFSIAEQVFLRYDEDHRDEQALRTSMTTWSELLLNYKHEEFVGRDEVDFVVLGFTRLLLYCVTSLKSFKKPLDAGSLMEQIFKKFLFVPKVYDVDEDGPSDLGLPVLESNTRKELYDLVLALAEDRTSYSTLLDLVATSGIDTENTILRSYAIERAAEIRSSTGYVGLYNPRAICYMNSLLTQLFMNVDFRKFLLGINVTGTHVSQRLLSETQSLFARMQNSFRKAADPRDFAACIRGLDGQPIDINIQMDADEFYNLLFDQWESQMLSTEAKQRFRTFYGGQTVNQIKSKECEHVSERVEGFFVVQCDVQGKANLLESLQAFVEGDVMEGDNKYKCESCGGKFVDAVKR